MNGVLYGVGVGPGDPELMTLKAVRLIKENAVIAVPASASEKTVALDIARGAVPEIDEKTILEIPMPMTKDPVILEESHSKGAAMIAERLEQSENVVFLTLGDPTVYATYLYVHRRVADMGYETAIVSGITSFCAGAALLDRGLVEKEEMLHIIPGSYPIEEAIRYPGCKVLMKSGSKLRAVRESLVKLAETRDIDVEMVANVGMRGESIYRGLSEMPEESPYYTLVYVKDKRDSQV